MLTAFKLYRGGGESLWNEMWHRFMCGLVADKLVDSLYWNIGEEIRAHVLKEELLHALEIPDARLRGKLEQKWEDFQALGKDPQNQTSLLAVSEEKEGMYRRSVENPLELLCDNRWYYKTIWAGNAGQLAYVALQLFPPPYLELVRRAILTGRLTVEQISETITRWSRSIHTHTLEIRLCALVVILEPIPYPFAEQILREIVACEGTILHLSPAAAKEGLRIRGLLDEEN